MSSPTPSAGTSRLLQLAIFAGAILFGIVIAVLQVLDVGPIVEGFAAGEDDTFLWIVFGLGILVVPVGLVLRRHVKTSSAIAGQLAPDAMGGIAALRAALVIEGGVLFNLVAVMLSGRAWPNAVPAVFGIVVGLWLAMQPLPAAKSDQESW